LRTSDGNSEVDNVAILAQGHQVYLTVASFVDAR